MNMNARLEELCHKIKEWEANAPIMGMGEFIPMCKRTIAHFMLIRVAEEDLRLLMDNNDVKHPMALFTAVSEKGARFLCTLSEDRKQICVEYLPQGDKFYLGYYDSSNE